MKNKIIIWGHKNNGHTHQYIHSSYYKAFKHMGYECYWFDDNEDVSNFNFNDSIFFTEDQVQKNIPLNKTCKYILHHTNLDKYIDNNLNYINLGNYLKYCDEGISPYHKENSVEKINDFCFWDKISKTIYQPWATDLIPDEIEKNEPVLINKKQNTIYYIGTQHDNIENIQKFSNSTKKYGINFVITRTDSDKQNMNLIRDSLVSVDIRGNWHLECGYLPCRVFKNISYGRITGTNSKNVKEKLGDNVIYNDDPSMLFSDIINEEKQTTKEKIQKSIDYIKHNHTYINRINNLLKFL
jgi:hypothetical protein